MMKGLKRPLVYYPATAMRAPYGVALNAPKVDEKGFSIRLSFQLWVIEDKKINDDGMPGTTLTINENDIVAVLERPLDRLTDVKLKFDFCSDAHCFDEIYAKVAATEKYKEDTVNRFVITSINPEDRAVFQKWMQAAA